MFQHDNDPKHTAKCTTNFLLNAGIEVLDWPPQSPDLNPIEHMWEWFKRKLSDYSNPPSSIHQLWLHIEDVWNTITKEECLRLIDSMPRRIEMVLRTKGGHTKY